jgi:aconitate hydratase
MIIPPIVDGSSVEIIRGPNIKPLPDFNPLPNKLEGDVLLKVEDDITTDHIMPAGAKILPLRSNIPEISKFVLTVVDPTFPERALKNNGGFIVGGENYGQGSSREHAAIAPKYLGLKAVIVKSFARIHLANLVNFGIVPLVFAKKDDYSKIDQGDKIEIDLGKLETGGVIMKNLTKNTEIELKHSLSGMDIELLKTGGKLPYIKQHQGK